MLERDNSKYGNHDASNGSRGETSGIIAYLAQLGLGDIDLDKVARLLKGMPGEQPSRPAQPTDRALEFGPEELMLLLQGQELLAGEIPDETMGDTLYPIEQSKTHIDSTVKLYVAEEQLVLKEAYRSFFNHYPAINTLGLSGDVSDESLRAALAEQRPDVLMLGLNVASASLGKKLELIRTHNPEMGLVLLFALYDAQGINALRDFSNNTEASYAYLLKHNIDTADQLAQVVNGVAQGRLIVDLEVMEELVENASVESKVLRALSPKELQVLSWMARGFANEAIAGVLYCEKRAVERQISNIYTKLQMGADQKDPRVGAVLMYLAATGQLPQT